MKVGTDAVLLGAAMTLPQGACRLLDIGTGTGVIALIAAQRLAQHFAQPPISPLNQQAPSFHITGIDIDPASAAEAAANFAASPWAGHLTALNQPLAGFAAACSAQAAPAASDEAGFAPFDSIFSNPPYFEESLRNPDPREATARHTSELSYRDIVAFAAGSLSPGGTLSLILPASAETPLIRSAAAFGLRPFRLLRIHTTARKTASRLIAEFRPATAPIPLSEEKLILMEDGSRTAAYTALTEDFYLSFAVKPSIFDGIKIAK